MDQIESRPHFIGQSDSGTVTELHQLATEPRNTFQPGIQSDAQVSNAFLAQVLPTEGYKCAMVLDGDRRWQKFFKTTDELADYILQQDGLGRTVYHACAVFKTPDNRKTKMRWGLKHCWPMSMLVTVRTNTQLSRKRSLPWGYSVKR
jgi:hypothetical protein